LYHVLAYVIINKIPVFHTTVLSWFWYMEYFNGK